MIKKFFLSVILLLTICSFAFPQNMTAADEFLQFKELRDKSFRNPQVTPLLSADLANFKSLDYFAFDTNYRIKANFVKTSERKSFLMPTSTGGSRKYLKIGVLSFKLNGKDFSLSAFVYEYASDHPKAKEEIKDLFVLFKDLSNNNETYSAGRYVYLRMPKSGEEAILDFNLAYNPNCAYGNGSYSCTLPPKENFLQVEIKAGEKKFSGK